MANAASGEEGFWTVPPGKLASQVKYFMTTDHGLTHSRSNKKDLGKKTS